MRHVMLDGHELQLQIVETAGYVTVSTYKSDPEFMSRLAKQLDAEFATGRYDAAFSVPREPQ